MNVAWVGWLGSKRDLSFKQKVESLVGGSLPLSDLINLVDGRDFLQERTPYDVVVICFILKLQSRQTMIGTKLVHSRKWSVSHLSTPENWRLRLLVAKPIHIIAFGGYYEIAQHYLEPIPGYVVVASDSTFVHFVKVEPQTLSVGL